MKNIIIHIAAIYVLSFMTQSQAGIINAGNTTATADGKTAALQGLDWLTLDQTLFLTRQQVETELQIGGSLEGWRYASRTETETLLKSLWGGTVSGVSKDNHDGADWFTNNFKPTRIFTTQEYSEFQSSSFIFGNEFECAIQSGLYCIGGINKFADSTMDQTGYNVITDFAGITYYANTGKAGYFGEVSGLNAGYNDFNFTIEGDLRLPHFGSLLVYGAPQRVVEPHSMALIGIAMLAMISLTRRFRSTAHTIQRSAIAASDLTY